MSQPIPNPNRRQALKTVACGFGSLALHGLLGREVEAAAARNSAFRLPLSEPRAKRIIFLFMQGGPSQVDTYDPKPLLTQRNGEEAEFLVARTGERTSMKLFGSPWKFTQHGESGLWVSELFPHMAQHADDYCVIRSMHTEGVAHGPATLFLHTGATNLVRPSMGSWITYGLGADNENLPGFITIAPPATKGGPRNYSNAFLPAAYQGTAIGRAVAPASEARFRNLSNSRFSAEEQRRQFDYVRALNQAQLERSTSGRDALEATIDSYELAFRMQSHAPALTDLSRESKATLDLYGIGTEPTDNYGRMCLMARKFAEAGVRYIQVNYSDHKATPMWDQHNNLPEHEKHAEAIDKPVAGLLKDLKARGLLEDTLVWWGGEFGRTPYAQNKNGRDHNPLGFSVWLAGGGVKGGMTHGATDDFGYRALRDKVHMHDLHATILHLLGLDHEKLTYRYAGRDFRLTDVAGEVVHDIIA